MKYLLIYAVIGLWFFAYVLMSEDVHGDMKKEGIDRYQWILSLTALFFWPYFTYRAVKGVIDEVRRKP
jgi:hypothetical protein